MPVEKSYRRLPLRDLMTDAEKRARDLAEYFQSTWLLRVIDLRELSRPVRRRSHYPTMQALLNCLHKVHATHQDTEGFIDHMFHQLHEIHEHAKREQTNRG